MLVGAYIGDEYIDIVLPQSKVNVILVGLIAMHNRCDKDQAKELLKSGDVREYCNIYKKEIVRIFSKFISDEILGWRRYDEKIKRKSKFYKLS